VRCNKNTDPTCLVYRVGAQISPDTNCDIVCNPSAPTTAMSSSAQAALKNVAKGNGTFYTTCPSSLPTSFTVLWIDGPANCSYVGNTTLDSSTSPGVIIINNGTFQLGGTVTFYGVIYALNAQGSTSDTVPIVETFGNAHVYGGILVDGGGNVEVASSQVNLTYADNAFTSITSNGTATPLQNTFRQIPH
jgi:hypothetical protein